MKGVKNAMTTQCFAAIKSSQEVMKKIQELAEQAMREPAIAPDTINEIHALAVQWNQDFQSCDPAWKPEKNAMQPEKTSMQRAMEYGAYINY